MPRPQIHPLSLSQLAAVYGLSKPGVADLVLKHGYTVASDPPALWLRLLEMGRAGKLRTRLSDPQFRAAAAEKLSALASR